jgi:hypothetical protein
MIRDQGWVACCVLGFGVRCGEVDSSFLLRVERAVERARTKRSREDTRQPSREGAGRGWEAAKT